MRLGEQTMSGPALTALQGNSNAARRGAVRPRSGSPLRPAIAVAIALVAAAGLTAYWWYSWQPRSSPEVTRGPGVAISGPTLATTNGTSNGTGGCSAPANGQTEYCYTFLLLGLGGTPAITTEVEGAVVEYLTTASINFTVETMSSPLAKLTFKNVTLLSEAGAILATYTFGVGWSGYGGDELPISVDNGQSCVLNFGTVSASGDFFYVDEGPWGLAATTLP
jgi:hypothetical protein